MSYKYSKMGKISNIPKVVDFYKNNGFNTTVTVEEKRTCIIDGLGTNSKKMLRWKRRWKSQGPLKKINKAFLEF